MAKGTKLVGWECEDQMSMIETPERVEDATTPVRGITSRDLDRELADWKCATQEAMGDTPVDFDERMLDAVR